MNFMGEVLEYFQKQGTEAPGFKVCPIETKDARHGGLGFRCIVHYKDKTICADAPQKKASRHLCAKKLYHIIRRELGTDPLAETLSTPDSTPCEVEELVPIGAPANNSESFFSRTPSAMTLSVEGVSPMSAPMRTFILRHLAKGPATSEVVRATYWFLDQVLKRLAGNRQPSGDLNITQADVDTLCLAQLRPLLQETLIPGPGNDEWIWQKPPRAPPAPSRSQRGSSLPEEDSYPPVTSARLDDLAAAVEHVSTRVSYLLELRGQQERNEAQSRQGPEPEEESPPPPCLKALDHAARQQLASALSSASSRKAPKKGRGSQEGDSSSSFPPTALLPSGDQAAAQLAPNPAPTSCKTPKKKERGSREGNLPYSPPPSAVSSPGGAQSYVCEASATPQAELPEAERLPYRKSILIGRAKYCPAMTGLPDEELLEPDIRPGSEPKYPGGVPGKRRPLLPLESPEQSFKREMSNSMKALTADHWHAKAPQIPTAIPRVEGGGDLVNGGETQSETGPPLA